ncbi:CBS domain-containing protein [Roseibium salinum]|uniref:CBS domain-containing protein n=1 Tax=Roseibium salinum TaxID=1604349 RepID=A0ABT3QZE1_9HYPH|nr:CBS domain-containing protein [Roseibium sp. DSM 29163]MCX2722301.1 CBS domain-containing protein [Roseibium sp. DSM 29163]MDN3719691.1 CBS domain-containing protein [Roseibium salinum]
MTVAAILSGKGHDTITVSSDALVSDVCETLAKHKIGAVLVCSEDKAIEGIVSERDIVRVIGTQGVSALKQPVLNVMTKNVKTCTEEDSINAVMSQMTEGRFRHLPVLKDGALSGVISIGDVVKFKIAQIELEAEQMRSYITMA